MNYDIGDKVVCVDDRFPPGIRQFYDELPVQDQTYVVRDMRLGAGLDGQGEVSVLLVGVRNPHAESKAALERGFKASRFVPLQTIQNAAQSAANQAVERKEAVPA